MLRRIASLFPILLVLATFPAHAKKVPGLEFDYPVVASRWNVNLGGFLVDLNTNAAVGIGGIFGTFINLEEKLGLQQDQDVLRLDGFYRFKPKHTLDMGYFAFRRDATTTLDAADFLDFDGYRFQGAIDSRFDMTSVRFIYKYSFLNNGQLNAGISTGLSWFKLELALAGDAILLDENTGIPIGNASFQEQGVSLIAPVPSIGVFLEYAPYRWLIVRIDGQFFDLSVSSFHFKYTETKFVLDFYFTRHVGLGIGLQTTSMEYVSTGGAPIRADYSYGGVLFDVGVSF